MTSKIVLIETERNVREKLQGYHLDRFFMLVEKIEILNQVPKDKLIKKAKKVIVEKDSTILSESKNSKVNILVTLDKKHFLTSSVAKFLLPQKTLTPSGLLRRLKENKISFDLSKHLSKFTPHRSLSHQILTRSRVQT